MAAKGQAQHATKTSAEAWRETSVRDHHAIPARLLEAAQELQFAYDLHLASRIPSPRTLRRFSGSRSTSLTRIDLQMRPSHQNARAKAKG